MGTKSHHQYKWCHIFKTCWLFFNRFSLYLRSSFLGLSIVKINVLTVNKILIRFNPYSLNYWFCNILIVFIIQLHNNLWVPMLRHTNFSCKLLRSFEPLHDLFLNCIFQHYLWISNAFSCIYVIWMLHQFIHWLPQNHRGFCSLLSNKRVMVFIFLMECRMSIKHHFVKHKDQYISNHEKKKGEWKFTIFI